MVQRMDSRMDRRVTENHEYVGFDSQLHPRLILKLKAQRLTLKIQSLNLRQSTLKFQSLMFDKIQGFGCRFHKTLRFPPG